MARDAEREWATFQAKVDNCIRQVIAAYAVLPRLVEPEKRGRGGTGGSTSVEPRVPINVDVIDLIREVDTQVDYLVSITRGALRLGVAVAEGSRQERTRQGLHFLGSEQRELWATDPATGEQVIDALWALRGKVGAFTREGRAPYSVLTPCVACGRKTVMVDPRRARARCVTCGAPQLTEATTSADAEVGQRGPHEGGTGEERG